MKIVAAFLGLVGVVMSAGHQNDVFGSWNKIKGSANLLYGNENSIFGN